MLATNQAGSSVEILTLGLRLYLTAWSAANPRFRLALPGLDKIDLAGFEDQRF